MKGSMRHAIKIVAFTRTDCDKTEYLQMPHTEHPASLAIGIIFSENTPLWRILFSSNEDYKIIYLMQVVSKQKNISTYLKLLMVLRCLKTYM